MKKLCLLLWVAIQATAQAQVTGSFVVNGDVDKYYPVAFTDNAATFNIATEMTLGRTGVHDDAQWRGAIIAKIRFHANQWGNGANFIDVDMRENTTGPVTINNFIGGWVDASMSNGTSQVVIWLRGGTTTYFYTSNYGIQPVIYDGILNTLPFQVTSGPSLTYKTAPDPYVNVNGINVSAGISTSGNFTARGTGSNYLTGPLAIGTSTQGSYMLTVNGVGIFTKVIARPYPFPDYVFDSTYRLEALHNVENYIKKNHHLSEIPSADSVEKNGIDLGGNQVVLLKKIEELTLYLIQQNKEREQQDKKLQEQDQKLEAQDRVLQAQQEKITRLEKSIGAKRHN
ncbi:MAG TPA: hypothetical protein VL832_00845 [Puia sp.]|nr:hypothetical protein [Puia sp.]